MHLSQLPYPKGFPDINELCAQATLSGAASHTDILFKGHEYTLTCTPFYSRTKRIIGCSLLIAAVPDGAA